ncbi:NAC domain-containing protein 1-like [Alnus glutinosa]|uniref:NAC domain-containing protein 1-like n=1 Tax=Alnus glutinosa TaxID=3517 RepID=UPI002D786361|nr:NAC domain-containing protein 1-like [Alnus glutinosa]
MEVKPNMMDSVLANDPRDSYLSTPAEFSLLPYDDDDDHPRFITRKRRRVDAFDEYFKSLPPRYRFCPNDDELVRYYLKPKVFNEPLPRNQIIDVNIYLHNPEFLAEKYKQYGENERYFFTRMHQKGSRPNQAADDGYWRVTGADKKVRDKANTIIGFKKLLVFYKGNPPNGDKTNWIMHEYSIDNPPPLLRTRMGDNGMREEEVTAAESGTTTDLPNNGEEEEVMADESSSTALLNGPSDVLSK